MQHGKYDRADADELAEEEQIAPEEASDWIPHPTPTEGDAPLP